jgi:iron complex outermembrane receptor protein
MYKFSTIFLLSLLFVFPTLPVFAGDNEMQSESPKDHYLFHMDEIIISTPMQDRLSSSARPVTILHNEELRLKASSTIGETLKNEMGVHSQSFGPNAGLPVIRGQHGPRVRVLNNGLGTNDASQASPDHASTAIPMLADRVEILRGPATLLYGSGAIGGVVNVIDNRIPEKVPEQLMESTLEQRYNSVSNEHSTAVKIEGGKNHFAYHLDGYYRENDNIGISGNAIDVSRAQFSEPSLSVTNNTDGFINNSSADSLSGTAGFSFVGDFGFFGFSASVLDNDYGIPPDGTAGAEFARIEQEQNKLDFKGEWNNPEDFFETIKTKLSFTNYEHTEANEAQFNNDTFEGRLEAPHKSIFGLDGVMGVQFITSQFSALDSPGQDYIVPGTRTTTYSAFLQESIDVGPTVAQFGFRLEHAIVNSRLRASPDSSFTPISVSVSDLWKIDDQSSLNLALTRSQRAPQVQELFFEGAHEATRSFERGNPDLKTETSYNIDLGYKFNSSWVTAELNLFHNWVNDYIYQQRTGAIVGGSPEVSFQQKSATFMGYEAQLIFPVWKNPSQVVDLTLFSDVTQAKLHNGGHVPQTPPLRWGFQVDHAYGDWSSNLRLTRAEKQWNSGTNEADTPGYYLLNLNTHYHVKNFQKADMLVYAKGNNLLNENIRNSASFLRNFSPEPGIGAEVGVRVKF